MDVQAALKMAPWNQLKASVTRMMCDGMETTLLSRPPLYFFQSAFLKLYLGLLKFLMIGELYAIIEVSIDFMRSFFKKTRKDAGWE